MTIAIGKNKSQKLLYFSKLKLTDKRYISSMSNCTAHSKFEQSGAGQTSFNFSNYRLSQKGNTGRERTADVTKGASENSSWGAVSSAAMYVGSPSY